MLLEKKWNSTSICLSIYLTMSEKVFVASFSFFLQLFKRLFFILCLSLLLISCKSCFTVKYEKFYMKVQLWSEKNYCFSKTLKEQITGFCLLFFHQTTVKCTYYLIKCRAGHIALWNRSIALRSWANLHFGSDGAPWDKERSALSELTKSNFERSAHERYKEKRAQ